LSFRLVTPHEAGKWLEARTSTRRERDEQSNNSNTTITHSFSHIPYSIVIYARFAALDKPDVLEEPERKLWKSALSTSGKPVEKKIDFVKRFFFQLSP
jgi:hypothetical protein